MSVPAIRSRRRLGVDDVIAAFDRVVTPSDDVFVVYSGIYTFAHLFDCPVSEAPERILNALISYAGTSKTLVIPSYSLFFARTRVFDVLRTKSDIGALPDHAITHPGMRRLPKPMYSYMVIGPRAAEFLSLPCRTAWSEDGVFGWMDKVNARFCILGVPWDEACSLYHYAEELERVPYRYFKRFAGDLLNDGVRVGRCEEVMYARSARVPPVWRHEVVYPRLVDAGVISRSTDPFIPLESAKSKDIVAITRKILRNDPYAYVVNVDEVKAWVADGAAAEIAVLAPDERVEGH